MTPYGTWPTFGGVTIADNKVYFGVTEHTPNAPMLRGYRLYCLDIETGELLWQMPGFFTSMAISGGKLVGYAGYDNQIYCYDKGLSETKVTATVGGGRAITIQGTVVDHSPGQTAIGVPAAGTPAISDENMDEWMAYLYMQQPMPTNATGVPVKISITDENGNLVYNTQTATDVLGHYATSWVPANNGLYTVNAAFEGTKSYYASTAVTSIAIDNEPNPVPTATPQATSNPTPVPTATPVIVPTASPSAIIEPSASISTETLLIAGAAVIIIIAVVAAALLLRKRL
jgi:outer membrane protein assembly factor BamB